MCLQIILINQDLFFLFNESATTEIYTLSLHDALPISTGKPRQGERYAPPGGDQPSAPDLRELDRKSTRLNSSHGYISYAVFCLKNKKSRKLSPPLRRT